MFHRRKNALKHPLNPLEKEKLEKKIFEKKKNSKKISKFFRKMYGKFFFFFTQNVLKRMQNNFCNFFWGGGLSVRDEDRPIGYTYFLEFLAR